MTSTDLGVVFLDREFNVMRFTPRARDVFNIIPSDLGRPVAHLTHRFDNGVDLPELARRVLADLRVIEREVASRDGRRYLVRLRAVYRSLEDRIDGVVMTFVDVTALEEAKAGQTRSEAALTRSEAALGVSQERLCFCAALRTDRDLEPRSRVPGDVGVRGREGARPVIGRVARAVLAR